jgi:rSAM/selenodomain-associated transferase 2
LVIDVVVPTLNEERTLGALLADLTRPREEPDALTITVADGGSTDATREVTARFPVVRWVDAPRGRGAQMNAGARSSQGDILFFLHADTRPPAGAFAALRAALADPGVAAGSFPLAFDRDDPWLRLYSRCSRINHPLFTYGDQGLFLRRSDFAAVGGFPEIPLMEDVEIQRRLRRRGRFVKLREPVVTSARRFIRHGVVRQQLRNAALVLLYGLGVSPERLARVYARRDSR